MIKQNIWLIGTGLMAIEYAKVLVALECKFTTIGRGKINCDNFYSTSGTRAIEGGISDFLQNNPAIPDAAIVAVGIESLAETTKILLDYGVKLILVEKPAVAYPYEIHALVELSDKNSAKVLLGYNRRFYASVLEAKRRIVEDGGVQSFQFEFTEWSHSIRNLSKTKAEHNNWFLGNSTHVIDTAFYIGGEPAELSAYFKGNIDWHPASSIFAGSGISEKGALFSYGANWEAPGRWVLEFLTSKHRYIFKPMEKLQIQEIGSVAVNFVDIDYTLDIDFKPGVYLQTKAFLDNDHTSFCDLSHQQRMISEYYNKMSGY